MKKRKSGYTRKKGNLEKEASGKLVVRGVGSLVEGRWLYIGGETLFPLYKKEGKEGAVV